MLLSIIIPLYNAEKYIKACLDSIYSEGSAEADFEVVVVDDGSCDDGAAIVADYARQHDNLKLIRQKNRGASAARNRGLEHARGAWVWFVDADDKIEAGVLKTIRDSDLESVEVICFNYREILRDRTVDHRLFDREEMLDGVAYFHRFGNTFLWNKLMRRDVLKHPFLDGTKNLEDLYFCLQNLLPCKRIKVLPIEGYCYNHTNAASTSLNLSEENLLKLSEDTLTIQKHILDDMSTISDAYRSIYEDILTQTTAGHLYSLLRYYPLRRLRYVIRVYRQWGIYPVRRRTDNRRMNVFIRLANCRVLLLMYGWIRNL